MSGLKRDHVELVGVSMTDDFTALANRVEAALWFAIGVAFLFRSIYGDRTLRKICWLLAFAFLLFGISDLIEAQTGAWWRPPWLLVWKGSCLVVIAGGFWSLWKAGRAAENSKS